MTKSSIILLLVLALFVRLSIFELPTRSPASKKKFINKTLYEEIRNISIKIMKKCPPKDCHIITIGRSPTPFTIFIERYMKNITTFPLSSFKFSGSNDDHYLANNKDFQNHLKNYLPSVEKVKNKKIMIVDYTYYGNTLFSAATYIKRYYKKKNSNFGLIAINSKTLQARSSNASRLPKPYIINMETKSEMNQALLDQKFDSYAMYQKTTESNWNRARTNIESYDELKKIIYSEMDKDKKLSEKIPFGLEIFSSQNKKCAYLINSF